jgi:PIN domain nuclease of toxin-antitoxin system
MEIFLADTHALLWWLAEDQRLGSSAKATFELAERGKAVILVPVIVLAESLFVLEKKRLELEFDRVLQAVEEHPNYLVLSLDADVIRVVAGLPATLELHDRIILAMANQWDADILTKRSKNS